MFLKKTQRRNRANTRAALQKLHTRGNLVAQYRLGERKCHAVTRSSYNITTPDLGIYSPGIYVHIRICRKARSCSLRDGMLHGLTSTALPPFIAVCPNRPVVRPVTLYGSSRTASNDRWHDWCMTTYSIRNGYGNQLQGDVLASRTDSDAGVTVDSGIQMATTWSS